MTKPAENVSLTSTCPSKVTKFVFGLRLISFLVFSLIVRNVCFDSSPSNKSFRWWWEARWRRWLSDVKQRRNLIKNAISFSSFVRSERRRFLELADTFCLWGLSDASVCVAAKDYWHLSGDWKFSYGVLWLLCSAEYSLTYDSSVANRQQQINFFNCRESCGRSLIPQVIEMSWRILCLAWIFISVSIRFEWMIDCFVGVITFAHTSHRASSCQGFSQLRVSSFELTWIFPKAISCCSKWN